MSFSEKQKEMMSLKKKIMDHDADIEKLENKKSEEIKKSQLPVEGLTFTEDNIFINGLPLEAEQINKAALFDIGVEIAMAINPNLKTIFLHDGSLFDKEHLKSVIHKIEERGYQAIVELVSEDNDVVIKFTENEA
jgi:predicted hydrocarbon binding protein